MLGNVKVYCNAAAELCEKRGVECKQSGIMKDIMILRRTRRLKEQVRKDCGVII